jgi:hypothetical protein
MAYVRAHDTKANARGRVVKRYEVIYRAKVRTEDGRTVTRLRQETHPTKSAAEAQAAELNARKHRRAIDPAEQRARGNRTFAEWAGDWLDARQTRVALGKLKQRSAEDYGSCSIATCCPSLARRPLPTLMPWPSISHGAAFGTQDAQRRTVASQDDQTRLERAAVGARLRQPQGCDRDQSH